MTGSSQTCVRSNLHLDRSLETEGTHANPADAVATITGAMAAPQAPGACQMRRGARPPPKTNFGSDSAITNDSASNFAASTPSNASSSTFAACKRAWSSKWMDQSMSTPKRKMPSAGNFSRGGLSRPPLHQSRGLQQHPGRTSLHRARTGGKGHHLTCTRHPTLTLPWRSGNRSPAHESLHPGHVSLQPAPTPS